VKEKKSGFTLVELLIVMTIVTLLMIMAIGTINPLAMVAKAKDSERKSDLNKIKK
jgi:prepilin-type N-terminal cleavage/methylation domain-containing protein